MTFRITEHDAFEADVLLSLDLDTPDPEHDRRVDFLFERLMTTDETVVSALLNSSWMQAQANAVEIDWEVCGEQEAFAKRGPCAERI